MAMALWSRERWTEAECEWLVANYSHLPSTVLQSRLRRSYNSIKLKASALGVRKRPHLSSSDTAYLIVHYASTPWAVMEERLTLDRCAIARKAHGLGLRRVRGPRCAPAIDPPSRLKQQAKLLVRSVIHRRPHSLVRSVVEMRMTYSYAEIARSLHITRNTVAGIVRDYGGPT